MPTNWQPFYPEGHWLLQAEEDDESLEQDSPLREEERIGALSPSIARRWLGIDPGYSVIQQ